MIQSCYGSKLLQVKVATYKVATPIKWVKVANRQKMLENPRNFAKKGTVGAKIPPVSWPWFTFSSVGPLKVARSVSLEQYNWTLKKLVVNNATKKVQSSQLLSSLLNEKS
jgi:hypothetical protein